MDAGSTAALITGCGAFATAALSTIAAHVRGSKVDKRALAIQELEASLKYRAEDVNSALERLKVMEDRVDQLDEQLDIAEAEKRTLRRENNKLVDRVSALEQEVSQLELDKAALQLDVDALRLDLQRLENGPRYD